MTARVRAVGVRETREGRRRAGLLTAAGALLLAGVTACGGGTSNGSRSGGFHPVKQTGGTLTVWVDSSRLAAAKLYQQQNPSVKMDIVTYDGDANGSNYLRTKVSLFNRTRKGWPDVVFSSQNNETTWAVDAGFAAPLNKGLIPAATLAGWSKGANDPCTVNGTQYCLRNDLAQTVLWYNSALMKQWDYQVPTTWEEYEALGKKVAAEHPGYLVGSAGDTFTPEIYMWSGKCGANQITAPKAVTVDTSSANCTRMASLLDTLITNKTLSKSSVFSSDFDKNAANRLLMMPGPSWYGGALFEGTFKTPAHQIAVAPMPQWAGDSSPAVGNVGGGTWLLSAHSANLKAATAFMTWVTTSNDYQGKVAPGYPAYAPAAKAWLANQNASGYFAGDIAASLQAAADQVWPGWGYGQFSQEAVWAAAITPGLTAGKTITSLLPAWKSAIVNYAGADGYKVTK
ncbi:multiple sugar transport system substrate-binding protein [Streptomyces sp. DvalAA-14]|uniref:ABC transporter substrate-binding protein n=1 Tax=unclassified Streptomyces TaxID=2593676 RepID=UPI00081B87E0|nr:MULTISPECIES: extracellular solute-binding protein [unclassified Streptomyces]MYS21185.1 extracellular solute-binding protein [Streptomyces sp. SID4948]SCD86416.1 multiple sugar transport system substrate-binding protein [Streptomyces sp. DvalAA-14]